jgi:hypothetical protein
MLKRTHPADAVHKRRARPEMRRERAKVSYLACCWDGTKRERHATVETLHYLRTFCRVAAGRQALVEVFQVVGWGRQHPWSSLGLVVLLVEVVVGMASLAGSWPTNT